MDDDSDYGKDADNFAAADMAHELDDDFNRLDDLQCPRCGEMTLDPIDVHNALSRRDNKTWICSACGNQEAFVDMGWQQEIVWFKPLETQND